MVETAHIFLIFLITTVQISMECERKKAKRDILTFPFTLT